MRSVSAWIGAGGVIVASSAMAAGVPAKLLETAKQVLSRPVAQDQPVAPVPEAPVPVEPIPAEPPKVGDEIAQQARTHRVRLAPDGFLPGKVRVKTATGGAVVPASDMTVWFVNEDDEPVSVKPGVDGVFQAAGLKPGPYSMIASGRSGYLAVGIEVLPAEVPPAPIPAAGGDTDSVQPVAFQEVKSSLAIDALAVPQRDVKSVAELVATYVPGASGAVLPVILDEDFSNDPGFSLPESADPATSIVNHTVILQSDGSLSGRMRRMHPKSGKPLRMRRLNVYLVKGDSIVSQAPVQENGVFTLKGVSTGDYSVVAAGPDGFMAFAVDVISPADPTAKFGSQELIVPVSASRSRVLSGMFGVLVTGKGIGFGGGLLGVGGGGGGGGGGGAGGTGAGGQGAAQGPGGGGTGSGGGGGGFGGGGGGLGGLLGLAGLGAGLAALADDDNNDDSPEVPVSP
jgi:hypothetical protein